MSLFMAGENEQLRLPDYDTFATALVDIALNKSVSELHGIMCAYLCAGADKRGEAYLRAMFNKSKDTASREAILSVFAVFSISQQQMNHFDFGFELLLPSEDAPLIERARAFSQWCEGFTQALAKIEINSDHFADDEAQEVLLHLSEFAELDYDELDVDEEDERALLEISEYTRVAIIRLHGDLMMSKRISGEPDITH